MPLNLIPEEKALEVLGGFASLPEEKKPQAREFILKYKHQQEHELGESLFPQLEEREAEERKKFYSLFSDVKKADELNPFLDLASEYMDDDPDYARKHEVGIQFLKRRYPQESEEDIRSNPDVYRADYAYQVWGKREEMDAGAFFHLAKKEVDTEQATSHALSEAGKAGRRAGIEGPAIRLQALREWQVQAQNGNGYSPAAQEEFLNEYDATRTALQPHRGWMELALRSMQRVSKGEAVTQEDRDAFNKVANTLTLMPPKERRAVFLKMTSMAEHLGKDARRGVGSTFTGSAGRLLEAMFGEEVLGSWRTETYLERQDFTQPQLAARYISGPEVAHEFLLDGAHRDYLSRFRRGLDHIPQESMANGSPRLLDANEQILAEQARKELVRRSEVGRDLKAVMYATDPFDESVWGKMAEGTGSTATMGASLLLGPVGVTLSWVGYRNLEYDELRRKYKNMTPSQADGLAMISGGVQVLVEKVGGRGLKVAPSLMKFLKGQGFRELMVRGGVEAVKKFGRENLEELIQDHATPVTHQIVNLLSRDYPQVDWAMEMKHFWRSRADVALGMIPLTLLGVGATSVRDYATAREMLSQHEELGQAGIQEQDRVLIIEYAVNGRMEEAQTALRAAWGRRSQEVAVEYQDQMLAQRKEAEGVLDRAKRLGMVPEFTNDGNGYTITYRDGTTARAASWTEARQHAEEHLNDTELQNADAVAQMGEVFLDQKRPGTQEAFTTAVGKGRALTDETNDKVLSEEEAANAAVTAGELRGMTREESLAATWQVMGSNRAEWRENVRTMVSKIYRDGHVLTAVEEPIEGRWKAGLENGRYTREQGLLWVRLAEKATGQTFLSATDAEVLGSAEQAPRSLTEAISAIVTADVLGRRRDGTRLPAGLVTRGVQAAVRQAAGAEGRGDMVRFGQFLRAWRALFGQVFSRARALNKAREEGRLGENYEAFLDDLMGTGMASDQQAGPSNHIALDNGLITAPSLQAMESSQGREQTVSGANGNQSPTTISEYRGTFSLSPLGHHVRMIQEKDVPALQKLGSDPFSKVADGSGLGAWTHAWKDWIKAHKEQWRGTIPTTEGEIQISGKTESEMGHLAKGEDARLHFQAAMMLPTLLRHSVLSTVEPEYKGKADVAEVHRRYAWMQFPDGKTRTVLLTVFRWDAKKNLNFDTAYSEEVTLEVQPLPAVTPPVTTQGQAGGATDNGASQATTFSSGIKPQHRWQGPTYSLAPQQNPSEQTGNAEPVDADASGNHSQPQRGRSESERKLTSRPWGENEGAVRTVATVRQMETHPDHRAAQAGDTAAAERMVRSMAPAENLNEVAMRNPKVRIAVMPSLSKARAANPVAGAYARHLRGNAALDISEDITLRVTPPGPDASMLRRMAFLPQFTGHVERGAEYVIVTDQVSTGMSVAAFRHYIERNGGRVVEMRALGNAGNSNVGITPRTREALMRKFGVEDGLNTGLRTSGFYGGMIGSMTEAEGREMLKFKTAQALEDALMQEAATFLKAAGVTNLGWKDIREARGLVGWSDTNKEDEAILMQERTARFSEDSARDREEGRKYERNIAFISGEIEGVSLPPMVKVSGYREGEIDHLPLTGHETIKAGFLRDRDSEVFLFGALTRDLKQKFGEKASETRGSLQLVSERGICPSCQGLITLFREDFPFIKIEVRAGEKPKL